MLPFLLGVLLTLLDQMSKSLVRAHFDLYESVPVIPGFFDVRYIQNSGAAWGLFAGGHNWLAGLSLLVLLALAFFHRAFFRDCLADRIAFGCLIGGITGNLIDRVRLNYVVDFFDFYWRGHHFPAFNVADSAICIGVGLVLLSQGLQVQGDRRARASSGGQV